MTTDDAAAALDGNAAAGAFAEAFGADMTATMMVCDHCGLRTALAEQQAYLLGPGVTLRCAGCGDVVARIVRTPAAIWLDLRGSTSWCIPITADE
jgi:hypothetical protein